MDVPKIEIEKKNGIVVAAWSLFPNGYRHRITDSEFIDYLNYKTRKPDMDETRTPNRLPRDIQDVPERPSRESLDEIVKIFHNPDADTGSNVNHPKHYNSHPSGIECILIARWYDFDIGNALKYLWRHGLKHEEGKEDIDKAIEDLEKAKWYIEDEIKMLDAKRKKENDGK